MKYYNSIQDLIGNTPLLKIDNFHIPKDVNIFAKLEFSNPGGSVKDRVGKWIIEKAENEGKLKKGYTIIEATAGNTGIGLALAAINKGYEIIFVVPNKFSIEKQIIMKALGAKIINTPTEEGLEGAFKKIEELKKQIKNVFVPDQFNNMDNPEIHYLSTGREIYEQLDGNIDVFISGAGSGGTFTGVMRYLKEKDNDIKGILADPKGSIIGGGECRSYKIEGIGNDFIPKTMDIELVDEVEKVSDDEAFYAVKELALKEGLLVGSSSGATFYAALKQANKLKKGNIVVIFADRADRYISKQIYDF
ncbi:PLP-dependent cysteine synthase family protein [Tepidibacter formicigenes]|jgi:cysteine synthase A|uniref:Cysteine synthase n=1 Tax=Tepidibacter formicigenes DSM 15518 TaxID=1123349 RepID=A0A1M6LDK0_9FIRM|nr:cysteine synthase family protein [Tepidibacter formicigenes]SHJ69274.1 cystathionine beta-synthase (acetylserine-dependent) [Tepidibacter formicigenes DSM 15518]